MFKYSGAHKINLFWAPRKRHKKQVSFWTVDATLGSVLLDIPHQTSYTKYYILQLKAEILSAKMNTNKHFWTNLIPSYRFYHPQFIQTLRECYRPFITQMQGR